VATFIAAMFWASLALPQGVIIPGAGAANRSMAGASTAAPLDAAGAVYWNPASISGLERNEVYFGADMAYADLRVGVDPLPPPGTLSSDTGLSSIPTIALVHRLEGRAATLGLGLYAVGGGSVNFPTEQVVRPLSDNTNQYASASFLQIAPILAVNLTEKLAVSLGPLVDVSVMGLDPFFLAPRNPDGTFPAATHGKPTWGAGFQAGAYYEWNPSWSLGLSYKSPQWFDRFRWHSMDSNGVPLDVGLDLTLPAIYSWGIAYRGFEKTVLALDLRYLDYQNTKLFGQPVVQGGVNWNSIFAVATGMERRVGEQAKVRLGYLYNENPIPEVLTLFNTQLPAFNQHQMSLGFGFDIQRSLTMDFAWIHAFENTIRGPVLELPGTTIAMTQSLDFWSLGIGVRY
jgi:long-chain fatty acid transport protein